MAKGPSFTGISLREPHQQRILTERPKIPWLEVISENYMGLSSESPSQATGPAPLRTLLEFRELYPIALHGVSLSIGSTGPLDHSYLSRLKHLISCVKPLRISDHLSWSRFGNENLHDLIPLPYTKESLQEISRKILEVQDFLNFELSLENPSSYLSFRHSEMTEWEFMAELHSRTGCRFLIDINNVFVSAHNLGFEAETYLRALPPGSIAQIHLAGHIEQNNFLIDTHGTRVKDPVWKLFELSVHLWGPRPTLIEWDTDLPELETLLDEAEHAELLISQIQESREDLSPEVIQL